MAKEIVWTKRANAKFNKIIQFLEEEWGEKVTANFVRRTFDLLDLLFEYPTLGWLEKPDKEIRGFLITKHNRLFYRIKDEKLILLNFFDTRSGKYRKKF